MTKVTFAEKSESIGSVKKKVNVSYQNRKNLFNVIKSLEK